jgi:hypothetical protein
MGLSMIMLGILLLATGYDGKQTLDALMAWWPVILCLLGAEILLYLWFGRKKQPVVRYDLLSIIVVTLLSMIMAVFAALAPTGIVSEFRQAISAVEQSYELPEVKQAIPPEVRKVVVGNADRSVRIDRISERQLHVFGSYRMSSALASRFPKTPQPQVKIVGDTMYVSLWALPQKRGPFASISSMSVTVVLPEGLEAELRGTGNQTLHDSP